MLAAIAALFTLMFALPQKAMAENYVTIDGEKKTILSTDFLRGNGDDNAFAVYLYLSSDKKEYVQVRGNKNLHATYDNIWLYKKEEKHEGQWYWDVIYTKEGYGKDKFWASGNPLGGYARFSSGYMTIYGDPRTSRKICGINLSNGKVTDTKHGDGQEHTITIDYKHERTKPSAGTFTVGTVTDTSIDLSWTHGSDETTPQDKLSYSVEYKKVGDTGWWMPRVGNATSYTIKGLEPETEYEVEINVYDESGNSKRYGVQTVTTKKATATKYGIDIGGVEITADNYTDISASNGFTAVKSGTVSYNPENRTLTLDNAVIERESSGYVIWLIDEDKSHAYTLVLKGNGNRLSASSATLATRSNLTITGGGSAQMTSKEDCGIFVDTDATLTITGGCSITAEGCYGIAGYNGESETLIIDGATVKAKGNGTEGSVCDFKEIVLKNCAITAPSGATIEGGNVKLGGEICTDWVTIEPVTTESYSIDIGGVEITADNYTDISASNGFTAVKSGTVSYNPENRTLTLDNAVIEGNSNSITFTDEDMYHVYTLVLKGNGNRLTSASSSTLLTLTNLTITGGGSAQMTSEEDCGIFVNTDATLTITGGCSITAEGKWGITGRDGKSETLIIDGATVKAKSNGEYGSICDFKEIVLKNCAITAPSGATIEGGNVMFGGEICTDWMTIEPIGTGIDTPTADVPVRKQGVYNLQGVRLGTSLDRLPKGIYVVDGKKVVKK